MGGISWAPPVNLYSTLGHVEIWALIVVGFLLLVVKIFAFANSLLYSRESYLAADRLNKATWTALLAVAIVLHLLPIPIGIVNLGFTIAALVYLADVRPALAGLRRR